MAAPSLGLSRMAPEFAIYRSASEQKSEPTGTNCWTHHVKPKGTVCYYGAPGSQKRQALDGGWCWWYQRFWQKTGWSWNGGETGFWNHVVPHSSFPGQYMYQQYPDLDGLKKKIEDAYFESIAKQLISQGMRQRRG